MPLLIVDLRALFDVVPTVQVTITAGRCIGPLIVHQIGMTEIDATINNGNHRGRRSGRRSPRGAGVEIRSKLPTVLTRVAQRPLLVESGVVGNYIVFGDEEVWLRELDSRIRHHLQN